MKNKIHDRPDIDRLWLDRFRTEERGLDSIRSGILDACAEISAGDPRAFEAAARIVNLAYFEGYGD
jgi:hypothetical protein